MTSIIQSAAPDYSSDDFSSIRARLISLCSSVFPNLDLESLAELATLLLETNAWIGDVLSFYLRATGREARITTATQRRGLLGLVKLIGFNVPGATAAQAQETFTIAPGLTGLLTLPAGTIVQTQSVATPIQYQLLADLLFPAQTLVASSSNGVNLASFTGSGVLNAGSTLDYPASGQLTLPNQSNAVVAYTGLGPASFTGCALVSGSGTLATGDPVQILSLTATVENSTTESDTFTSTGAPNQSFLLTQTPYIDGSLAITDAVALEPYDAVENPTGWRQVTNFLSSLPTDRVYTVSVDNLDRALVTFGNGVTGAVPSGSIVFGYKVGGGSAGTVTSGALTVMPQAFLDASGNPATITVDNPAASTLGADRFTVAQIQQLAPASLTVQTRSVSNSDYSTVANLVPGVLRTLFLTATEDPSVPWNQGIGFVVPIGGGQPTPLLLAQVLAQFQFVPGVSAAGSKPPYPKPNAFPIQWLGVDYLTVNVSALVYLAVGANPVVVGAAIRAALTSFFAPSLADGSLNPTIDFGYNFQDENGVPTGTFAWSTLFDLVASVAGVSKIDPGSSGFLLNGARADVPIGNKQFPVLGSVTLVNGTTGQAF